MQPCYAEYLLNVAEGKRILRVRRPEFSRPEVYPESSHVANEAVVRERDTAMPIWIKV